MEQIDLNLLRVFDALMEQGSVTAAAEQLHLSVPATSRALARLRRAMGDPVMVRAGRGLVPTPFAVRSAARVRALLEGADTLLGDATDGDPATWRRTFRIRINDGLSAALAPRLMSRTAASAPGVSYRFVSQSSKDPEPLRDGSLDLDLGVFHSEIPDLHSEPLLDDRFVALVSTASGLGEQEALTVKELVDHPHVSASRRGLDRGPLDEALDAVGEHRRVIATVPTYAVAIVLALESDVIALVPHVLASHLMDRGMPVRWAEIPLPLPDLHLRLRWHRRLHADRQNTWLRERTREAAADLDTSRALDPATTVVAASPRPSRSQPRE
jgi:DNA-binding transcriptional LysR family regulator